MRLVRGALLAAGTVLLVVLVLVLLGSKPRQSGSNYVPELEEVAHVRGDGYRCQSGTLIPADTDRVRILIGTYGRPAPELGVTVSSGGRRITSGVIPQGGPQGHVEVPLQRVDRTVPGTRVCVSVKDRGGARTVLYGSSGVVRLEWVRPGDESWFALAPTVAHRFGFAKANPVGSALLWVAGLVLLGAWGLAGRLVLREVRQ